MSLLSDDQIARELERLPRWHRDGRAIVRTFDFANYLDGLAFVQRIATEAEHRDHHPDLTLQYRSVDVLLTSHDAGGITARDLLFAEWIDEMERTDPATAGRP